MFKIVTLVVFMLNGTPHIGADQKPSIHEFTVTTLYQSKAICEQALASPFHAIALAKLKQHLDSNFRTLDSAADGYEVVLTECKAEEKPATEA